MSSPANQSLVFLICLGLAKPVRIDADQPILVGQFSLGTNHDGVTSDPFFALVPPTEQFLDGHLFATLETGFQINFVGLIVPNQDLGSLRLDGDPVDPGAFTPIGSSDFSGAAIPLAAGVHRLKGAGPFGITVYGFDQADSYGYPGGMAFAKINPLDYARLSTQDRLVLGELRNQ